MKNIINKINFVNKFKECYNTNKLNTIEFIYCINYKPNNTHLPLRIFNNGLISKFKYYKLTSLTINYIIF